MHAQRFPLKWLLVLTLAVCAVAAIAGHPILSPEVFAGLGLLPVGIGNVADVSKLTELVTRQGEAWEEFKSTNDARLKAIEERGYAPADLNEKLAKINADLAAIGVEMRNLEARSGRPNLGGSGDGQLTPDQLAHREAFIRFCRKGDDAGLAELQRKALNSGSDPDGGYLVLPEMDREIDRIAGTVSALPRLARVVTIGSARWQKVMKTQGMTMRRVNEGATGGESTPPKWARITVDVFPAEVEPWVDNETLEDASVDLAADLAFEAGIGFAEGEASEFITGNGVGKARGITAYDNVANASYAWGKVGYIASGKSAAFTSVAPADAVINLQHALRSQYRAGAVWLANDATVGVMRQLKDQSGSFYLWQPDPAAAFGGRFLGAPVEVDDNMPDIGAGAYALAYGNFQRGYAIVRRTGTTLIRDNVTSKGTTKFNFRRRFGGGIYNFEAIKLMKFATS